MMKKNPRTTSCRPDNLVPYYQDESATIYHGDCLDVLGKLEASGARIDGVITDPPYASGARTEMGKKSSGSMLRGGNWADKPIENDQMTTAGFVWFTRQIAFSCKNMMPDGASFLSFIDWRNWPNMLGALESVNLRVNNMIVWDKATGGLGNGYRGQHELIVHASKGVADMNRDIYQTNVIQCGRESNAAHPSPKPEQLMLALMSVMVRKGDLILDPLMGCGPVLTASKLWGAKSIGIEINEQYCEIAANRLTQSVLDFERNGETKQEAHTEALA